MALLTFFSWIILLLLLFCRYRFFFLAFVNKQNFKHLREIYISGRKKQGQSRLGFLGLLVSLEEGFRQMILL